MLDSAMDHLRRFFPRISFRQASDTGGVQSNEPSHVSDSAPAIRLATFNAAMFSMASAVPSDRHGHDVIARPADGCPKGILKQRSEAKAPKRKVSINLPDNEISLNSARLDRAEAPTSAPSKWSVMDVLREVGADVVALQNVKADEEKGMRPLSELAHGLGMEYVFAESWSPEYGNAVLSRWPIKRCRVQRILDDSDFRNVLKATIEVPAAGEINFHCTHLDHLDEKWRMKQINKILQSADEPHILAGGLNSLDETDYSAERWAAIVKYYTTIGKPSPNAEVMNFLRESRYVDAKAFAGECEPVVILAKGQDVQGTCKYGTRVDYILASPDSPYDFVPGSYMVVSSKGTSDHHIVRVDIKAGSGMAARRRKTRDSAGIKRPTS